jgi:hypothetical protein
MDKPILALDFDGVLHSYTSGWQGYEVISDPPVPGAREFVRAAAVDFAVVIVSSRANSYAGTAAIHEWLRRYGFPELHVTAVKPAAFVALDDRALQFVGVWPALDELRTFQPWTARPPAVADCTRWNAVMESLERLYEEFVRGDDYVPTVAHLVDAYDKWLS